MPLKPDSTPKKPTVQTDRKPAPPPRPKASITDRAELAVAKAKLMETDRLVAIAEANRTPEAHLDSVNSFIAKAEARLAARADEEAARIAADRKHHIELSARLKVAGQDFRTRITANPGLLGLR